LAGITVKPGQTMNPSNLAFELKKNLPEDSWGWVVRALRQDTLVWDSLENPTLMQQALQRGLNRPEDWSPAALALLSLEYPSSTEEITTLPVQPMASSIRPRVMHEYEDWQTNSKLYTLNLYQAGLLALSFRERRRVTGNWEGFSAELKDDLPGLKTILACLYGMVPDPFDLLQALFIPEGSPFKPDLGLHALLSNPLPENAQSDLLSALLEKMSILQRQTTLSLLAASRPNLAAQLAQAQLLPLIHGRISNHSVSCEINTPGTHIEELAGLLLGADAYRLANQPASTLPLLSEALQVSRHLQAGVAASLGYAASWAGDHKIALEAWKQANQLSPGEPFNVAMLALALLDEGRPDDAHAYLAAKQVDDAIPLHPATLLASAMLSARLGEISEARQFSRQALELAELAPKTMDVAHFYTPLARLCLDIDLPGEATRILKLALALSPEQPDLLDLTARALLACDQPTQSLQPAIAALACEPKSLARQLLVIECLEAGKYWSEALEMRKELAACSKPPSAIELRALANCAIQSGQVANAIEAAEQALQLDPNDGLAYNLLGESALSQGNSTSALEYFNQATQLSPLYPSAWISMARTYHNLGQDDKAIEVLRASTQASPSSPETHLALGEAYLVQGAPTQALTSLRRAAALVAAREQITRTLPKSSRREDLPPGLSNHIALQLGQTLHRLGHLDEARRTLENAYIANPDLQPDSSIAYAFAKTLLDQNEFQKAAEVLEVVVSSQPTDHAPYLDYARTLLQLDGQHKSNTQKAITYLTRVLEFKPRHAEAQALLAEAYAEVGDLQNSMDEYRLALDTDLARETSWHTRLSLGFGRVALALGQYETAIAALQEAAQAQPLNSEVQCGLSEAYLAMGLVDEAHQAACNARQIGSSDLDTLVWFADQSLRLSQQPGIAQLQAQSEAINALNLATQLAPSRTDLLIRLGQTLLQTGDEQGALNTFGQLSTISDVSYVDLYHAAQNLRRLNDPQLAIKLLNHAITIAESLPPSDNSEDVVPLKDLFVELAITQRQAGDLQAALAAQDRAIEIAPQDPVLSITKADFLLETGHSLEALKCIQGALNVSPANATLHLRAASILRTQGNIPAALSHAEQAVLFENVTASSDPLEESGHSIHGLVTELALAMLQFDKAHDILHERWPAGLQDNPRRLFEYACLRAEVALDAEEEANAIEALEIAGKIDENHPRYLANKARLFYRKGNSPAAVKSFKIALLAADTLSRSGATSPLDLVFIRRTLVEAAIELDEWEQAIALSHQVAETAPQEPLSHFQIARLLVLRAEKQRLCQALNVIQHAPSASALDSEAYLAFETAIQTIEHLVDTWKNVETNQDNHQTQLFPNLQVIVRWKARGQAAFLPGPKSASDLRLALASDPGMPDETAALVTALGQTGESLAAAEASLAFPQEPMVLRQLSLAMAESNPRQALGAARNAVNIISTEGYRRPNEIPLFHTLLALLAHQAGERENDRSTANQAIHTALASWPDEPRWHVLAAEIALGRPDSETPTDPATAVVPLEQAARLEPFNADHELALGRIYLQTGNPQRAIQALEQASRISPDQPDIWLMLAKAQLAAGELVQAALSADRAIDRSADPTRALLVRGEIDLQTNNPQEAQRQAQAVIQRLPDEPDAYYLLARALSALDKPAEALDVIERGIPLTEQPLPLLLERARLLRYTKGLEDSLETLRGLAEHYPEEPAVLALLAETLVEAGRGDAAIHSARMALQADRGNLDTEKHTYLHYLVGRQLRRAGQLDQAIYHLNEAIQQAPDHLESYLELGRAHQDRRQLEQALHVYQQAIEVSPNDHRAYYQAGLALKESKDYVAAEAMVRHAAELAPNDVSIHRLLGALVALNLVHNRQHSPIPA
jgi:tetratricopeptide (TPR) repeat protein